MWRWDWKWLEHLRISFVQKENHELQKQLLNVQWNLDEAKKEICDMEHYQKTQEEKLNDAATAQTACQDKIAELERLLQVSVSLPKLSKAWASTHVGRRRIEEEDHWIGGKTGTKEQRMRIPGERLWSYIAAIIDCRRDAQRVRRIHRLWGITSSTTLWNILVGTDKAWNVDYSSETGQSSAQNIHRDLLRKTRTWNNFKVA